MLRTQSNRLRRIYRIGQNSLVNDIGAGRSEIAQDGADLVGTLQDSREGI